LLYLFKYLILPNTTWKDSHSKICAINLAAAVRWPLRGWESVNREESQTAKRERTRWSEWGREKGKETERMECTRRMNFRGALF